MLIEVGDFSDLGEAWIRYKGNRRIANYRELLRNSELVDPTRALSSERDPQLVQYYDLQSEDLDGRYAVGGCWVFRVLPHQLIAQDTP